MDNQSILRPPVVSDYLDDFEALGPDGDGRISAGERIRKDLLGRSGGELSSAVLHRLWKMADIDRDGKLNLLEYSIIRKLIDIKLNNENNFPKDIPISWIK